MKIVHVQKTDPPVISITVELTREEAIDLAHLLGSIVGDSRVWPQRSRTYDKLWGMLSNHGLATRPNPLRFRGRESDTVASVQLAPTNPYPG